MKKLTFIVGLVFLVCCLSVTAFAVSGKGTEANPFRITTEEELLLLADFPDCYFELENDIVYTGTWVPVENFGGNFDGKGHTITVSSYKTLTNTGFFSVVSGSVKNLVINADNLELTSNSENGGAGVIAGICSGNIIGCEVTGTVTYKATGRYDIYGGGICDSLTGSISQCINTAEIILKPGKYDSYSYTYYYYIRYGGIATWNEEGGVISDCVNLEKSVSVLQYPSCVYYSGIAYGNSGEITNCYSAGGKDLSANKYGIVYSNGGTMTNCYYDKTLLQYTGSSTAYGIPKSTLAMMMSQTYVGWDFENTWAVDESEENPINNGYPYLRIMYPEMEGIPITQSSAEVVGENIVIDTKITEVSDTNILHIALYDKSGTLVRYIMIPNERKLKDAFAVIPDGDSIEYAKIFTWSALNQIQPISKCETIYIER